MKLGPRFLVNILLCSFICVSNGAPPGEVGKTSTFGIKYTKEEDQFIVDELSNVLDGKIPIYRRSLWEALSEKHNKEVQKGTPGFPTERTACSLLYHFTDVLSLNHPHAEVKVPQDLKQKLIRRPTTVKSASKYHWNKQENDFIIEELSKRTNTGSSLFSASTLETLRAEHNKKRLGKTPGFETERTMESIYSHLWNMNENCQLPPTVLENCPKRPKVSRPPYKTDEENFIIEELSKPHYTGSDLPISAIVERVCAEHDKKRLAKTPGFETVRTPKGLRKHISLMKNKDKLPDEVVKKLQQNQIGASSSSSTAPDQQTNLQIAAGIIEELPNNTDYEHDFSKLESTGDE